MAVELQGLTIQGAEVGFTNMPEDTVIPLANTVGNIPTEWTLSTDLTDKFIISAGDTYSVDQTGGNLTHFHTGEMDPHEHTLPARLGKAGVYHGAPQLLQNRLILQSPPVEYTTNSASNLPEFVAMPFITNAAPQGIPPKGVVGWTKPGVPPGFDLADGNDGRKDLRNKFIIGAGDTYAFGDTGGADSHVHTGSSDQHFHQLFEGTDIQGGSFNTSWATLNRTISFTTNSRDSVPPNYALTYIQNTSGITQPIIAGMVVWTKKEAIPTGYVTPHADIVNKLIVGAGDTFNIGDNDSTGTHTHTGTANTHTHPMDSSGSEINVRTGANFNQISSGPSARGMGTTDSKNHIPPFRAFLPMMKT